MAERTSLAGLQLGWLEAFVTTADLGKQSAAAATLGVSESTISRYLDALEAWYGAGPRQLLFMSRQTGDLTPSGKQLLLVARQVVEDLRGVRGS